MKISKLIKIQDKDTTKAIAIRDTLAKSVIDNINSAHGIARTVHYRAHLHWSAEEEKKLLTSFKEAEKDTGFSYSLLSRAGRTNVLQTVASKVHRSPLAVQQRLKSLGKLKGSRGGI